MLIHISLVAHIFGMTTHSSISVHSKPLEIDVFAMVINPESQLVHVVSPVLEEEQEE